MINVLSYIGLNLHWEVCLWCLLGLVRTIFDATLFKVNSNLKQVWQMTMPEELSRPVQRVLRTMISGVMLVQCFTVYVYLASYIVLLYPIFLEERPTLVLPWLLLAAVRKLLCELTSLALGLGVCVLLGPARPPCIKFLITKLVTITPAFYMWLLIYSYYNTLKVASSFKTFPLVAEPNVRDFGLELAVRRRRTKSLLAEDELRKKIVADLNCDRQSSQESELQTIAPAFATATSFITESDDECTKQEADVNALSTTSNGLLSDLALCEDWPCMEAIPRDTDRILEQIVLMMLRISTYMKTEGHDPRQIQDSLKKFYKLESLPSVDKDTSALTGSGKGKGKSPQEYSQTFLKNPADTSSFPSTETQSNNVGADLSPVTTIFDDTSVTKLDKTVSSRKLISERNKHLVKKSSLGTIHSKDDSSASLHNKYSDIKRTTSVEANNDIRNAEVVRSSSSSFSVRLKEEINKINSDIKRTTLFDADNEMKNTETVRSSAKSSGVHRKEENNVGRSASVDSIENIIDKMRGHLTHNSTSLARDESKHESMGPSSSRAGTAESRPWGAAPAHDDDRETNKVGIDTHTNESSDTTLTNDKSTAKNANATHEEK